MERVSFAPGKVFITVEPAIQVEGGLPPGRHVFELIVVNDKETKSVPVTLTVLIAGSG